MTIFRIILKNENIHALFQAKILLGRKLLMGNRNIYGRDESAGELGNLKKVEGLNFLHKKNIFFKIVILPPAINAHRRKNLDVSELSLHFWYSNKGIEHLEAEKVSKILISGS